MSTKCKTASSLDALGMNNEGVVVINQDQNAPKKKGNKTMTKNSETSSPVEHQSVDKLQKMMADVEALEASLLEQAEQLKQQQADLEKREATLKTAAEKLHDEAAKLEKKATKTSESSAADDEIKNLIAKREKEMKEFRDGFDINIRHEDMWTTTKRNFVAGAAVAGGALTVIGAVKLIASLLGGGNE